jgi:hypothetical protein
MRYLVLCLLVFCTCAWASVTPLPSPKASFLVVDATPAMKQRMQGTPKSIMLRQALAAFFAKARLSTQAGLVTYGQRPGCMDTSLLSTPHQALGLPLAKSVKDWRPGKGKAALGLALERAAQASRFMQVPTTLVVVTQGGEECHKDPCEVARALKVLAPSLTVNVLGLGVQTADQSTLRCVAKVTGGDFVNVKSRQALQGALTQLLPHVARDIVSVSFRAYERSVDKPLQHHVSWQIFRVDERKQHPLIEQSSQALPHFSLDAGDYFVQATWGEHKQLKRIHVQGGEAQDVSVVFGAARVTLKARLNAESPYLHVEPMLWLITKPRATALGRYIPLALQRSAQAQLRLPFGSYRFELSFGGVHKVGVFDVDHNNEQVDVVLDAGMYNPVVIEHKHVLRDGVTWLIRPAQGGAVYHSVEGLPHFVLPAGRYKVVFRYRDQERVWPLQVVSGDDVFPRYSL